MHVAVAWALALSAAGTGGIADAAEIADAAKAGRAAEVAAAAEVAGVELADEIELGGVRLRLNGAGERTLYVVRTYVAALYVAQPSMHAADLYGRTEPRRLSLTMLAGLSTEWIVERLVAAIRAVMEFSQWFPPAAYEEAAEPDRGAASIAARFASLTPQQFRVLELLARGKLNKQIAAELGITEQTTKAHVSAALAKLGARNRTQATLLYSSLEIQDADQLSLDR